jgi:hypothetical protein
MCFMCFICMGGGIEVGLIHNLSIEREVLIQIIHTICVYYTHIYIHICCIITCARCACKEQVVFAVCGHVGICICIGIGM